jgi:hypothetical protein
MQSSLTVFSVWDTPQVGGWQNDRAQPIHPAPTLEKRRPSDKNHQQWYGLQPSGLWRRGTVPSQPLRPVQTPDPARARMQVRNSPFPASVMTGCRTSPVAQAMHSEKLSHRAGSQKHRVIQKMRHWEMQLLLSSLASSRWPQIGHSLQFAPGNTSPWLLIQDH